MARREYERYAVRKQKKKLQTGKLLTYILMVLLILNCVWVERFSMQAMLQWGDLSALPSLITAVVSTTIGEVVVYGIYSLKSYTETKQEELMKLERDRIGSGNAVE